jgi:hypothetical protein
MTAANPTPSGEHDQYAEPAIHGVIRQASGFSRSGLRSLRPLPEHKRSVALVKSFPNLLML